MRRSILVLLLLTAVFGLAQPFELTLTGFVELGKSSANSFDWKTVEIVILNEENKIEAKAQPTDTGFYLIPVQQRKNYRLQARSTKKNIKFSPEFHEISLKGKSEADALSAYDSSGFNFKFAGFSLHSVIKIQGQATNLDGSSSVFPEREGVVVKLMKEGTLVHKVQTNQFGEFWFEDIVPGQYVIKAEEPTQGGVKFLSSSYTCTYSIEKGPNCSGDIILLGTKFMRPVLLQAEPLQTGSVNIRSSNPNLLRYCSDVARQTGVPVMKGFDCAYKITRGSVVIPDLPHGQYEVSVQPAVSVLKLLPTLLRVTHPSASEQDKGMMFSGQLEKVVSRVVTSDGIEIPDAEIKLNSVSVGKTDVGGQFVFEKLEFQQYTVEVHHPKYQFQKFSQKVDLETYKHLQTIHPVKFAVCGKLDFKNDPEPASYEVSITLEGQESKETQRASLDSKGTFCFMVPSGTYTVKPSVLLKGKNMPVIPKQRTVVLQSTPITNVDFSREQLVIKGVVEYLPGTSSEQKQATQVGLWSADNEFVKSVKPNSQGAFEFSDLLEDGYSLRLTNPNLCFLRDAFGPNEFASEGVKFVHKGVVLQYKTEVSFKAKVNGIPLSFDKTRSTVCVPVLGKIKIEADDTFLFKRGLNLLQLHTSEQNTLSVNFEVEKVKVAGTIRLDTASFARFDGLSAKIQTQGAVKLSVKLSSGQLAQVELTKSSQSAVWRYVTHLPPKSKFELSPVFEDAKLTQRLLVSPPALLLDTTELSDSLQTQEEITISAGKIISAKLSKEVKNAGVQILWRSSPASKWTTFHKTSKSGDSFTVAPVDANFDYDLKIKKRGYMFGYSKSTNSQGDLNFVVSVSKISELIVKIRNEQNQPLSGVSVYLTSMNRENYLKTTLISNSHGLVRKVLAASSYFTKFVLKEYEFTPAQQTLSISEGEKTFLKVRARRTQFSVLGSVRHFGGSAVQEIKVEATCLDRGNEMVEEAVTDANGNFAIKGLVPGKKYSIKVKADDNLIVVPDYRTVVVEPRDTLDMDFVLTKEWNIRSIKGKILLKDFSVMESKAVSPLRVVLKEEGTEDVRDESNKQTFSSVLHLYGRRSFEFRNLKKGIKNYELQVYTKQSSSPVFTHLISADELKSGVTSLPDFVILKKNLTDQPESNLHIVSLVVTVAILLGLLIKFRK